MKVLITAIVTVGTIALCALWLSKDVEVVKLAIASIGSLATGVEIGKAVEKRKKDAPKQ